MKLLAYLNLKPNFSHCSLSELKSLAQLFSNKNFELIFQHENLPAYLFSKPYLISDKIFTYFPFIYIDLSIEQAQAVFIKTFIIPFAQGNSLIETIKNVNFEEFSKYNKDSFAIKVLSYQNKISAEEQRKKIDLLIEKLPFQGKVDLKNPKYTFWLIENFDNNKNHLKTYFGLEIPIIQEQDSFLKKYSLSHRTYLGPTSADINLAFFMSNLAQIKQNDIMYDPFVGTGGLIIPAGHFQAICFGSDIDLKVLHGTGVGRINEKSEWYKQNKEENVDLRTNFRQYGLLTPELWRFDVKNNVLREREFFDCVVCDPPYGLRASAKETGKETRNVKIKNVEEKDIKNEKNEKTEEIEKDKKNEKNENNNNNEKNEKNDKNEKIDNKKNEKIDKINKNEKIDINEKNDNKNEKIDKNEKIGKNEKIDKNEKNQDIGTEKEKIILEKSNKKNENSKNLPLKISDCSKLVNGLFILCSKILKSKGRLVFLYPWEKSEFKTMEDLLEVMPKNDKFELEDVCENLIFNLQRSRLVFTYIKK